MNKKIKREERTSPAWTRDKSISPGEKEKLRKDFNEYVKKEELSQLIKRMLGSAPTIFGGNATSRKTVTNTDVFGVDILKKMSNLFNSKRTREKKIRDSYVCLIHPRQRYDLYDDFNKWVPNVTFKKNKNSYKGYVGTYMKFDVFTTNEVPIITKEVCSGVKVYRAVAFEMPLIWNKKRGNYWHLGIDFDNYIHAQMLYANYLLFAETGATFPLKKKKKNEQNFIRGR